MYIIYGVTPTLGDQCSKKTDETTPLFGFELVNYDFAELEALNGLLFNIGFSKPSLPAWLDLGH